MHEIEPHVYAIRMRNRFRGIEVREGVLLRGKTGWGEFCAFGNYSVAESAPWFSCAYESAMADWPEPVRERIPVNCTVPAVSPERAYEIVTTSGCHTAKVKVADPRSSIVEDCDRVAAVRDALGGSGGIRVDANGAWDVDDAVVAIGELDRAAKGLEYVEQPCPSVEELAAVRRKADVRVAADESIRLAEDPLRVAVAGAADVAVLKVAPLGGVHRALRVAEACGLPCVVSSAVETSVGLAAGLALAGALPGLEFACGLGTTSLLTGDVVPDSLSAVDGWLPVPRRAPAPDPALLRRYAADPATGERWLSRLSQVAAAGV
ncbi:o-succinylbenzoate synthase [Amycolatopsis taiwanensis]|uniref:o-succinylbenzoate synthase n=1 Tax=Amycolatopsis taiwanensis TaxID=342230 RepID=A0A9W6R961_9PSEU|nr:o-succinylbenzoate synthase [Amycolatopsis taiwanensis]GLY71521.1 o-succinylbenzoate synthase [Amycolatopsis taiwanensis]